MTQDERWLSRYNEVVDFIKANKRNPSRHRIEGGRGDGGQVPVPTLKISILHNYSLIAA